LQEQQRNGSETGWLDIEAMRKAAGYFEGLHDFRNFCKVDASKQIDNFLRRMFHVSVVEAPSPAGYVSQPSFGPSSTALGADDRYDLARNPKTYVVEVHGSAFLWHQVRHMVAILFLVGQGLEAPEIVPQLLDVDKTPTKPLYEMAADTPLVLWNCIFPDPKLEKDGWDEYRGGGKDALEWVYDDEDTAGTENGVRGGKGGEGRFGVGGVVDVLWKEWRAKKIDECLIGSLLDVAVQGHSSLREDRGERTSHQHQRERKTKERKSQKIFNGGDSARSAGNYVPVLEKQRSEEVEVVNQRYKERKERQASGLAAHG
jgi:tRNA pseudouridine38/39 synthase